MRLRLGIDNGKSGALVLIDENEQVVDFLPMPQIKGKKGTEYDTARIKAFFNEWATYIERVTLERTFCMPTIPRNTAMSLGWCLGYFEGLCSAFDLSYVVVDPKTWQKKMLPTFGTGESKIASIQRAQQLQPKFDWTLGKKNPHDGLTDAYHLARYHE